MQGDITIAAEQAHTIAVVGASAGGVESLSTLVAGLPADLPMAIFVVLHLPSDSTSLLPHILSRAGPLPAVHAQESMVFESGKVYVAPPDRHLLLDTGVMHLSAGPKENGHRPAVDPLFRSAARSLGRRVVGVILSGALDDGTMGLAAIKLGGGVAIIQDPTDALFPGMPSNAAQAVDVDYTVPVREIPSVLVRLATAEKGGDTMLGEGDSRPDEEYAAVDDPRQAGSASIFTCPECHGTLFEIEGGRLTHYRCRVGHAYGLDSLHSAQGDVVEAALWMALRAIEERAGVAERLMRRARQNGQPAAGSRFEAQAQESRQAWQVLRQVIAQILPPVEMEG